MDISVTAILTKMTKEVQKAHATDNVQHLREHIAAVRILCDLILEGDSQVETSISVPSSPSFTELTSSEIKKERIDIGDDANGPSLFDF
ncbi:YwdI family protein [Thermaerobacillus caldiproteolyticus]|uniref:YwdI family protein n=1 Tax=Thermaerobacillus caldiproteolyticus TaxID=247480 RepID=A0A7W0BXC4_9BACL|nr:YwdI family protein [Anoxybacillus caldiproteolyticus]MBA2874416.1 hypothetical protein [Anoxybacillus caldiproteolyticus]QPA30882.1 YwdI family protein [Anoxybacillus caldiproteolyticus]